MSFMLRTRGNAVPISPVGLPIQLGVPMAFNLSRSVPGSDTPAMTFLIDPLPPGMALMPVSRSAQTILAPGVSSQQDRWSSAEPRTHDVSWEGPFDAYCAPMDTGECPLVATGLPGCPFRITSYTRPAVADTDPAVWYSVASPTVFRVHRGAGVNLQRDAGLMSSNLQILYQFVTSLQWMSSEVLSLAL